MDITAAGAASWDLSADLSSGSGDCGGNTGSFVFPISKTRHFVNTNGGTWSTETNWATSTAGPAGATIPLCQDDVYLDTAFGTSKTITADLPRLGRNIDWTSATWTTALTWTNSQNQTLYGSLTLIDNSTLSGANTLTFAGRGSFTFAPHSLTFERPVTLNAPSGTLTLAGDLTLGVTRTLTASNGTFTSVNGGNNYVISAGNWAWGSAASLILSSVTHLVTGSGFAFTGTFNAGGADINAERVDTKVYRYDKCHHDQRFWYW